MPLQKPLPLRERIRFQGGPGHMRQCHRIAFVSHPAQQRAPQLGLDFWSGLADVK